MIRLVELAKRIVVAFSHCGEINALARLNPSNVPAKDRKPFWRRYLEIMYGVIRWNEISTLYYAQHLDRKERHETKGFLCYAKFRQIRDEANGTAPRARPYHYACLLQDKLLFERYFSAGGIQVATSLGVIKGRDLILANGNHVADFLFGGHSPARERPLFVKPRYGIKGRDAFKLQYIDHQIFINNVPKETRDLENLFLDNFIVQDLIEQHPAIAQFHPASLNTLRVISYRDDNSIRIFLTYLRIAAGGNVTDNNTNARVVVRVNESTGDIYERGFHISGPLRVKEVNRHPDTDLELSKVSIPHFEKSLQLVKQAHQWIPDMRSIGWDIAITNDGPILLEGNDDWGAVTAMWVMPEFAPNFIKTHKV